MPTKEEVAKVEATVDGWIKRGEDLVDKATPAVEKRNVRIVDAYNKMEVADEKVFFELVDELEKAQDDFVKDLTRAEERFERILHSNGAVADFEALGDQIEKDLQRMEQMHSVIMKMKPAVVKAAKAEKEAVKH